MKLLICTQAVDANDPVLGFFTRWIEEFSLHCEHVTVVCLREGAHSFSPNVEVVALGKGKVKRALQLLRRSVSWRRKYDAVFVHMNPEYLLVAGLLWRALGKKTVLWYAHGTVNLKLRLATFLAHRIATSTPAGFRIATPKLHVLSQGIDTAFFSPGAEATCTDALLSVGRLMKSKRHDLAIRALQYVHRDLFIGGEGPELTSLQALAEKLQVQSRVHFLGGLTQAQLRDLYRRCGVFVHTSETGSLDKVILEALACGLPVVTTNKHFSAMPVRVVEPTPQALAAGIGNPIPADSTFVARAHALPQLIQRITALLE